MEKWHKPMTIMQHLTALCNRLFQSSRYLTMEESEAMEKALKKSLSDKPEFDVDI